MKCRDLNSFFTDSNYKIEEMSTFNCLKSEQKQINLLGRIGENWFPL